MKIEHNTSIPFLNVFVNLKQNDLSVDQFPCARRAHPRTKYNILDVFYKKMSTETDSFTDCVVYGSRYRVTWCPSVLFWRNFLRETTILRNLSQKILKPHLDFQCIDNIFTAWKMFFLYFCSHIIDLIMTESNKSNIFIVNGIMKILIKLEIIRTLTISKSRRILGFFK